MIDSLSAWLFRSLALRARSFVRFIFQCVQTGNPSHAESAFLVFDQLARYCMDMLVSYLGTIHGALSAGLANPSLDVKIAAFSATSTFIGFLESASEREKFQSLVPALLGVLSEALNAGDEVAANTAVENLIGMAHGSFSLVVGSCALSLSLTDSRALRYRSLARGRR